MEFLLEFNWQHTSKAHMKSQSESQTTAKEAKEKFIELRFDKV